MAATMPTTASIRRKTLVAIMAIILLKLVILLAAIPYPATPIRTILTHCKKKYCQSILHSDDSACQIFLNLDTESFLLCLFLHRDISYRCHCKFCTHYVQYVQGDQSVLRTSETRSSHSGLLPHISIPCVAQINDIASEDPPSYGPRRLGCR